MDILGDSVLVTDLSFAILEWIGAQKIVRRFLFRRILSVKKNRDDK